MDPAPPEPPSARRPPPAARGRSLPWLARYLHTYVSLAGFGALVLFSITGLTLNHATLFEGASTEREVHGQAPLGWIRPGAEVNQLQLVEWLRAELGISGHLGDLTVDEVEIRLGFEGAGYASDLEVDRRSGAVTGYELRMGLVAIMNDLHKGRGTGAIWSLVIDVSAVVLTLSGLTGIWLLWHVRRRRVRGLLITAAGAAALALVVLVAE